MQLLLDTSAVVGLVERRDTTIRSLVSRSDVNVAVSTISIGELEHGARRTPNSIRDETLRIAADVLHRLEIDDALTPPCFGHISVQVPRAVGVADCWIGATAVVNGFDLVTQDRAFADQLARVDWSGTAWKAPTVTYVPVAG